MRSPANGSRITSALVVRDADEGDYDGLRFLWTTTWLATYGSLVGPTAIAAMLEALNTPDLREMLPQTGERVAVAVVAGEIVGSAVVAERGQIAYLWGMYIAPAWQRQGLGSALLRHCATGITIATMVEVRVLASSPRAIAFYKRGGFAEIDREEIVMAPGCPPVPGLVMNVPITTLVRHLQPSGAHDF